MCDCPLFTIRNSLIANLERHPSWDKFQTFQTANFGIGGDKVENVLYRLKNGEISNLKTKIVVILAGTNNTKHSKPHEIYEGIIKCVSIIKELLPSARIILPTMLPRGRVPNAQRDCLQVLLHTCHEQSKWLFVEVMTDTMHCNMRVHHQA
ncbi:platelet-activating factor acetylhydrolase IB subunit gamma-like [Ctenocephalides felis]|uniref:platelet-activating factor acetylhydrolase IB subunit gamma-like n=1 Tax=Ctenocephalides felis TaxID=7515 RepID=UPI000E6E24F9|nr:platelet-activating factor acetylhydrolase IB subunit gamma-like [Ctenocephalides felis]XP_026475539.1 platelet-activating factor acetylhydrolase IB subunit gamma-like [Ctenocephalides felis]